MKSDTIAAIATASGRGGVGVIRISGSNLLPFAFALSRMKPQPVSYTHLDVYKRQRPDGENGARLGLVIGKKFVRRAVDRNQVKRVVRERFRCLRGDLPAVDVVVRLMVKSPRMDRKMLAADALALLEKLKQTRPALKER